MADEDAGKKKDPSAMTPAERAALGLDAVLGNNAPEDIQATPAPGTAPAQEAEILVVDPNLRRQQEAAAAREAAEAEAAKAAAAEAAAAAPQQPERQMIRLVLVTTDASIFSEGSQSQNEHRELAAYFDELHVVVLSERESALPESLRIASNVWAYATNSRSRLFAIYDAYRTATKQLSFAAGFRADVVAATDPFEAGLAAYFIARRHSRPLQIEVRTNPFEGYFVDAAPGNRWRLFAARYVIPRTPCVLVRSAYMRDVLGKRFRVIAEHIQVLPPFRDLTFFKDAVPSFDLRQRYPQFKFVLLVVSKLDARSNVAFAIDTCAPILKQYPTIGLVIVGSGPERAALEKKTISANLQNQIEFEPESDDLVSHMKTANLLVNVANTEENDATIAAAAAAGLPVLTTGGGLADMIFEDGTNAFVCPEHDVVCFQARIGEFLNNNQLRSTFSINGRSQVFAAVEQDAESYRQTYVRSFEKCLLTSLDAET